MMPRHSRVEGNFLNLWDTLTVVAIEVWYGSLVIYFVVCILEFVLWTKFCFFENAMTAVVVRIDSSKEIFLF